MPILSSIAGAAAKAYGMMANAKRIIIDTFNRADGSLGTSSSGHLWSVLTGTWAISSNKATSSTAGSSYPLASVDLGAQNGIISADITDGGPGLAFWITDANSWWASSVNYRNVYTSSGYYSGTTYSIPGYYANSLVTTGYTCPSGCFYSPAMGECLSNIDESSCGLGTPVQSCTGAGANCNYVPPSSGCGPISGSANCGFVDTSYYTYYTELKLYRNLSGTISNVTTQQINSNTSGYSKVNSIKAITAGESITVQGYSNTGLSSQLGSNLTYNASGATRGTKAGIIKTPSDASAGSLIDNFSVETN